MFYKQKTRRIEEVQAGFAQEFAQSWIKHKVSIDTSELPPRALLRAFLAEAAVHFSTADMLRLSMLVDRDAWVAQTTDCGTAKL
jgi:hypothetical protein